MKGVLSIAHSEEKFVYQAVHMIFKGNFDVEWEENEERLSKLVFIGKNLNHDELRQGFKACLYSEERAQHKLQNLRFKVGDAVECKFSGGWRQGVVVVVMFKARMPGSVGKVAPYCVKLTGGSRMLAPTDHGDSIRKAS